MKAKELRDIAARLNRIADEMEGIKTDGGTLRVTLPQPDLFSQMGLTKEPMEEKIKRATESWKGVDVDKFMADVREVREQEAKTCRTCGFYENNCPYIRGKFIPYPSRVCEDYTSSVMKEQEPRRRTWKRLGVQMKDEAIVAAEKVGRKSGWCQRSDIERSLQRRNPERSREEIREAVNAAVKEMRLTCVKYNSYRFYRRSDRGRIIAAALARLTA